MGVGGPRVIPKEKHCQPWLRWLFGCNMVVYMMKCCCLPIDCFRVSWVAVKLRHDAHLSTSSHLFGMPGLW
ncbi:hypothetical protein EVAR_72265_1 [Eumeta japonica]|uniref:Uncharacterized protein n=1 Tax=Eumeta variegata TaxID=151549 RepID=A0A4C1SQJ8_EUMVA|nr:hypothetical protein EVAR_72265_1 [Eumeta japonica]